MPTFPQLTTGVAGQFPILKRTRTRTVHNQCLDGHEIKLADPAAFSLEWQLVFRELTDGEIATLLDFFLGMEGTLQAFTFLDPTANLLAFSQEFDQPAWQPDPLLQIAAGAADPWGGMAAYHLANSTAAGLRLLQTLNAPASYVYAFSVWARSDIPGTLTLHRGDEKAVCTIGPEWNRLVLAGASQNCDAAVTFGVELPADSAVDLFGAQVEWQVGASMYKATTSTGGVWANTRFADNALTLTTAGPGRHGFIVRLRTN